MIRFYAFDPTENEISLRLKTGSRDTPTPEASSAHPDEPDLVSNYLVESFKNSSFASSDTATSTPRKVHEAGRKVYQTVSQTDTADSTAAAIAGWHGGTPQHSMILGPPDCSPDNFFSHFLSDMLTRSLLHLKS